MWQACKSACLRIYRGLHRHSSLFISQHSNGEYFPCDAIGGCVFITLDWRRERQLEFRPSHAGLLTSFTELVPISFRGLIIESLLKQTVNVPFIAIFYYSVYNKLLRYQKISITISLVHLLRVAKQCYKEVCYSYLESSSPNAVRPIPLLFQLLSFSITPMSLWLRLQYQ